MQRRDFVKAMLAASVTAKTMLAQQTATPVAPPPTAAAGAGATTAPGPVPWMQGLMEVKPLSITPVIPDAVAQTNAHFFSDTQMATLRRLSEIMLPPLKGYPGAVDAGAPEFLDFLIGVSPADRQHIYRSGLERLDAESRQKFGTPFAGVRTAQADELLRPWLRTWMEDHPPTDPYEYFINVAHNDIRTATINSQAWSEVATAANQWPADMGLYWFPVDPDIHRENAAPVRRPARTQRHSQQKEN